MPYEAKSYDHLLGLAGFSDTLLKNHFTLYQGYVTNTNKLCDQIAALGRESKQATPEFAEAKRRFGWEWNGMRLHELYFGNLAKGGKPLAAGGPLAGRIARDFGSVEACAKELRAVCAMRGVGWGVLTADPATGRLFTCWINEHDVAHLAGGTPLLVIDVFEHAYLTDYGIKRADYLEALWKVLDWETAERRLGGAECAGG